MTTTTTYEKSLLRSLAFVNIRPFVHNIIQYILHARVEFCVRSFVCLLACFFALISLVDRLFSFAQNKFIAVNCACFVWFWFWFRYTYCLSKTCFLCHATTTTATHYFILCSNLFCNTIFSLSFFSRSLYTFTQTVFDVICFFLLSFLNILFLMGYTRWQPNVSVANVPPCHHASTINVIS